MTEEDLATIEARAVLLEAGLVAHARADIPALVAEVRRLHPVFAAAEALFHLKDTGSSDDLYRAWRELGAQLAFARGRIPLGSDADLRRMRE